LKVAAYIFEHDAEPTEVPSEMPSSGLVSVMYGKGSIEPLTGFAYFIGQVTGELRHASYVGHWIKILKGDSKAILTAASLASKATDYLRGFSEKVEDA
jgi:Zincin-like metallopeptidase